MPIMPMWPNLQPRATDPLWFNADSPCDDESEVLALEAEHEAWKEQMRGVGCEQIPIGKSASDFRTSEEEEEEEEEEEGEGEEEEESDTHEEEEEEFDDIDMEVSYSHQQQRSSPTDTVTDPVSIRMIKPPRCKSLQEHTAAAGLAQPTEVQNRETLIKHSFAGAAPTLWNRLPPSIRQTPELNIFKKKLYRHLLDQAAAR